MISCPLQPDSWWHIHVKIGTLIAAVAVLGVIAPWHVDFASESRRTVPKIIWSVLLSILAGLEIRTIYTDSARHDLEQAHAECIQLQNLKQVREDIDKDLLATGKVLEESHKLTSLAKDNLSSITGGLSYSYVNPTSLDDGHSLWLEINNAGKYPLRNLERVNTV